MIDSRRLLQEAQKLLPLLEKDIRERLAELPAVDAQLQEEWNAARQAKRTADTYFDWREETVTQSAVHWILACVFLRFLEDNGFLACVYLTSSDAEARDSGREDYEGYFRKNPNHSDLEYLVQSFRQAALLPGLRGLFNEQHNPLFRLPLSGDGGVTLLAFWRKIDSDTGSLAHDFTDPAHSTRFLGNLYQDLSESARERYALLQTPEFVEEFILDRTLKPAVETFGYKEVRLIDPTCGSGHFLLGAFRRLFNMWVTKEPARNLPDLVQQALNGVYGVDLNPFAVEIARFRLLVEALTASGIRQLKDAPDFRLNLASGDSLLHGPRFGLRGTVGMFDEKAAYVETGLAHAYESEELPEVQRILGQQYHVVVGNPPYITPKDARLRDQYRKRYFSCHRSYSLGVPFTERFFDLARSRQGTEEAGYVGMITANSFMKREFGKKLIEQFFPTVDLTHIIDASGAYLPGHGTPTVILFGRQRLPVDHVVRTVMGIKGEPSTPIDAARGRVWLSIVGQVDLLGSEGDFVSVIDLPRTSFAKHPWSLGGGGASELKADIEANSPHRVDALSDAIGFYQDTHADEVFMQPERSVRRMRCDRYFRWAPRGDDLRDWTNNPRDMILFPYNDAIEQWAELPVDFALRWTWSYRTTLWARSVFGGATYREVERPWWDYHQFPVGRAKATFLLAFAEIATHNHFVLDRGGRVFNRTAPVIKLAEGASETEHIGLLGLLNSSVACFWLKQVCTPKGGDYVGQEGARVRKTLWDERYAFNSTNVARFPIARERPEVLATLLDQLARETGESLPHAGFSDGLPTRASLNAKRTFASTRRRQMIALQEELDWHCYRLYGVVSESIEYADPPELELGERAFEIVLARQVARGEEQTTWFERHGSTPITELPSRWPDDYRAVVQRRIALIESDRNIGLIERPEYKRRWNTEAWEEQEQRALREWLLDRLESARYWPRSAALRLRSVFQLSDLARSDADFMQVAALYAGRDDFDLARLIGELAESDAVPYLTAWRYTDDGLRKREAWEQTWALQRKEDAIDAAVAAETSKEPDEPDEAYAMRLAHAQRTARRESVGEIPVPPKYRSSDFRNGIWWRLRGALDVPKERFVGYPGATPDADGTLLLGWAGWDHLQQATALAGHYIHLKENEGWEAPRLVPLLVGLRELVPWLKQWHNEWDAEHDARMGDYFEGFVQDEARALGTSIEALPAWRPAAAGRRRARGVT